jgi:predicted GNAT superfamily acetyltransferase
VPGVSAPPGTAGFRLRRLDKPEEFRAAEELQRAVLGDAGGLVLPAPALRSLQDNGGLVVGAFADIYLAGCSISTIGWDGTTLYHYSHLTAVRPEYQNHHVGFRLKTFQRDEVLALGLGEIRWAFDPLVSRTAWLSIGRLGAVPDRYLPHYFGRADDGTDGGLETDRLRVRWTIGDAAVARRLEGTRRTPEELLARWRSSVPLLETEPGESGLRLPTAVADPTGPTAHLEVPFDVASVRTHEAGSVRRWRHAVRDAFRAAFDAGYVVDEFAVLAPEHERRAFYFLAAPGPPATPAG